MHSYIRIGLIVNVAAIVICLIALLWVMLREGIDSKNIVKIGLLTLGLCWHFAAISYLTPPNKI